MPKIAISYRRSDSQDITGRIFDRLSQRYGKDTVFRDIDSIQPGIDFRAQIADALTATDVLLVVVGPRWLGRGEGVGSRIDNEADPVRIEVETALKRGIPIIPVLVGGLKMPEVGELPSSLKDLAYRQAVPVDGGRDFDHHVEGLIRALDRFFPGKAGVSSQHEAVARSARKTNTTMSVEAASTATQPSPAMRTYALVGGLAVVVLIVAAVLLRNGTQQSTGTAQPLISQSASAPSLTSVSVGSAAQPSGSEAEQAWSVTKDTTSVAVLNDFIRQFGDTPYGSMARARVQELLNSQATAVAQPIMPPPQAPAMTQPVAPPPQAQTAYIATSASPSFDCTKARAPDEREVCRNGELSYLDRQLDVLFGALRSRLDRDQRSSLMNEEEAWLRQRAACRSDDACLRDAYQSRLAQLRSWQ